MADKYNPQILFKELLASGLPVQGCASNGRIDWDKTPNKAQLDIAAEVLAKHNPEPSDKKRSEAYQAAGVTVEALIVALWEREVEGRPEAAAALQAKREQVKTQIPTERAEM